MDTWIPGYLDTWIPGYLDTWIPGYLITHSILQIVQMYVEENSAGKRKCPPFNDLEDLSDSRILLRLINALLPQTFTPEVLLNDR